MESLKEIFPVIPNDFVDFMQLAGGVEAINFGGGFWSLDVAGVWSLTDNEGHDEVSVLGYEGRPVNVLPRGTNGGGEYFFLACDDSGMWRYNLNMRPIAKPVLIADGALDFFSRLAEEWRGVASGRLAPYMTG